MGQDVWQDVEECVKCPLKYKTGCYQMCNLGAGEIPERGIHRNCPVMSHNDVKLVATVRD